MKFNSVTVIGLGLIGGSICRAIKEYRASTEVIGIDADKEVLDFAVNNGIIDRGSSDYDIAIDSEIVVIATYVDTIPETFEKIVPSLNKGTVVTDTGSVKSNLVNKIDGLLNANVHFVGSHPIAGTQFSGIKSSDAELFKGKDIVITPTEKSKEAAIKSVTAFWGSLGGRVINLDPATHDKIFAYVSHLPHVVAYSLINSVASSNIADDIFNFSGGGLKDYTRIAASSPEMWKTIFMENKDSILESIEKFKKNIEKAESAIKNEDLNELNNILEHAQKLKLSE
ncbi:MAG: prephenate dehydrogenase [Thermodesulfobacteriota bacterium]